MKKNIKNLSLSLLALGLSSPVFANPCNPLLISVPQQQGGFSIGADALYMQPSVPNGSYITIPGINVGTAANQIFNSTVKSIDPSYHWGFDVSAAYRIPCTGNDISATWTHLGDNGNDTDTTSIPIAGGNTLLGNGTQLIKGSLDFSNYDAVDLDVGQRVNFGDNFQFRTFAGARWAQVKEDLNINNTLSFPTPALGSPVTISLPNSYSSKFNGIGPQFGFDGRYCLGYGFGLDGNLTTSLLIGKTDTNNSTVGSIIILTPSGITVATQTENINVESKTRVVPAVDASLGLDYTYNFNNCDRSSIVVQAGWKVINYWGIAHGVDGNIDTTSPSSYNIAHNIVFQGPYVGIKANL